MSKVKTTTPEAPKEPKTIQVRTVVIAASVFVALVASFVGGIIYANNYNDTVKAQAIELSKQLNVK